MNDDDDEMLRTDLLHHSPRRKRKRVVHVDEEARDQREYDSKRARIYEQRRKENQLSSPENISTIVINPGKSDEDVFIHINREIGSHIKEHQIEGTQFMWREVVSEEDAAGGCLLAHTMGLGKTLQV
jgi:SNF2 family DNA or RNA helicase